MIFLITGLFVVTIAVTGGYLFWSGSEQENGNPVSSQSKKEGDSMGAAPSQLSTHIEKPITDGDATTPAPPKGSIERKQVSSGSAQEAFNQAIKEKFDSSEIHPVKEAPTLVKPPVPPEQPKKRSIRKDSSRSISNVKRETRAQNDANWLDEISAQRRQ
jgi:hypothetical protein